MKKNKGITLIALVVTIIVLLILAGVAISLLMGENGIVNKTEEAKDETIRAKEREIIKLAYQNLEMERATNGTDITTENLREEIRKYEENTVTEGINESEIGDKEIVIKKEDGVGYAEIEYTETGHEYVVSLVVDTNISYNITYNLNGGTVSGNPTQYNSNTTVQLNNPVKRMNKFIGWTGSNGNEPQTLVIIPKGSTGDKQYTANWIEAEAVCKIGDEKYATIQEAVEQCSKTAGEVKTTITMIKSTNEEFKTYNGQNIILDLNGYTVTSSNTQGALCTNNGELQIIDSSSGKTGKIESINGIAVINNGTFTIGDNSTSIEQNTPTIYGKQIGIKNDGILNFYDGKIQGITPIQGIVSNTPAEYGPVETSSSNGITTLQLGIINIYEARIGWVYYTKLQDAIDNTKKYNNGNRDTVTVVKNIQVSDVIIVSAEQEICIDLDGYQITTTPDLEAVVENYGELEITDNSINQDGNIIIDRSDSKAKAVNNKENGSFVFSGGIITSNSYGIYNESTSNVKMTNGTINIGKKRGYGIYNKNSGQIEVTGGTINCIYTGYTDMNGIYNNSTGTIIFTGGTIICDWTDDVSLSGMSSGIYNADAGLVIMNGGIIKSKNYYQSCGIYNAKNGTIRILGGEINSGHESKCSWDVFGVYNADNGYVEISGGTITSANGKAVQQNVAYGLYNKGNGTIKILGGTINSGNNVDQLSSYAYGIYNVEQGKIEMLGGEVNTYTNGYPVYGVYNKGEGNIEIKRGIINSINYRGNASYGIFNSGIGRIIIGDKEENYSYNEPTIQAKNKTSKLGCGLYNGQGNIEFYNGMIKGSSIAIIGTIIEVRENYTLQIYNEENTQIVVLTEIEDRNYVAQIDDKKYYSLQDAIDSVNENEEKTIEVIENINLIEPIKFNKNIILDLNGYKITTDYYQISNNGNLKILDSSIGKTGKIVSPIGIYNEEAGNLIIEAITIDGINNVEGRGYGICHMSSGIVQIKDSTINALGKGEWNSYGIYIGNSGSIEIENTEINSTNKDETSYGIYNAFGKYINIKNSEIYGEYGIYNESDDAIIEITNTTIENARYGIYNDADANILMTGGIIKSSYEGIYNSGTVEMVNVTIENTGNYGIYNSGTVKFKSGSITSSQYGIYNRGTGAIIEVGIKGDGNISEQNPYIKSIYTGTSSNQYGYAIYNTSGKFYFYDGKLEGSLKAVYTIITEREENTYLNYNEDETILTLTTELPNIAQVGDKLYTNLQTAINEVETDETVIKVLKNITYTSQDAVITIPSDKNIILDLNGYKITSAITDNAIQNEGRLKIIDTSENQTGKITTNEEKTIYNSEKATLIIAGGTIENTYKKAIENEGEITVESGTITTNNSVIYEYSYSIYNKNNGNINITGGDIINNSMYYNYGIFNAGSGKIKMTNGNITSISRSYDSYGTVYNASSGIIEIIGGVISSEGDGAKGIVNRGSGDVIIGKKGDGIVSQEQPVITADGLYGAVGIESSRLFIYDGVIKGEVAISQVITEIEQHTQLLITNTDDIEEIKLITRDENEASMKGVEYDSLVEAIKYAGTEESTIKIINDIKPGATIIINSNQNITIDLNGHILENYIELQNKGTLKIIDTSTEQTGKILGLKGIAILNNSTMEFNGGAIVDSGYGIQNRGTLKITGGEISNNIYGIYNNSKSIDLNGGIIKLNEYGVYNTSSSGIINVNSSCILDNSYGIYVSVGTVNINETVNIESDVGIRNVSGTIYIGKSENMNSESPIIIGETYGIENEATGKIYMYDGQIKGKTGAIQGLITYTEEGYTVASKQEGEYNISYLALSGTADSVAEVNGINYSNLQSAINSIIGTETQTIKLTNGIITTETFTISEGQNIILDMNGKTISSDLEITLINNGNLTIIDTSEKNVARITSTLGVAIENNGTLTLGEDDEIENPDLVIIEGKTDGIDNKGTLNIYDGTETKI